MNTLRLLLGPHRRSKPPGLQETPEIDAQPSKEHKPLRKVLSKTRPGGFNSTTGPTDPRATRPSRTSAFWDPHLQTRSPLFRLPAELRVNIWHQVFARNVVELHIDSNRNLSRRYYEGSSDGMSFFDTKKQEHGLGLLLSCRQTYEEAVDIMYSETTFLFTQADALYYVTRIFHRYWWGAVRSIYLDNIHKGSTVTQSTPWKCHEVREALGALRRLPSVQKVVMRWTDNKIFLNWRVGDGWADHAIASPEAVSSGLCYTIFEAYHKNRITLLLVARDFVGNDNDIDKFYIDLVLRKFKDEPGMFLNYR